MSNMDLLSGHETVPNKAMVSIGDVIVHVTLNHICVIGYGCACYT